MQAFTGRRVDLPPLNIDRDQNKFSFLAFGGPVSSTRATEYMGGTTPTTTTTSQKPLFETNTVGNNLYDTFAKTGVFNERYKDIANPIAYGVDFNVVKPSSSFSHAPRYEKLGATGSDRPHYMVYTEKSDAYDTLGYQERWQQQNKGRRMENSVVSRLDDGECMQGQVMVNNQCFAVGKTGVSCPAGFVFDSESQFCVPRRTEAQQGAAARCLDPAATLNEKNECVVKMM